MNAPSQKQGSFRMFILAILMPLLATFATLVPQLAHAGNVECMLPGEIRTIGGHPTMGPRHPVQTSMEDCKQRGGEYTVPEPVAPVAPVASVDSVQIRCLLPRQTRQLGSKARYLARSRVIHTSASDCKSKQGRVLVSKATR